MVARGSGGGGGPRQRRPPELREAAATEARRRGGGSGSRGPDLGIPGRGGSEVAMPRGGEPLAAGGGGRRVGHVRRGSDTSGAAERDLGFRGEGEIQNSGGPIYRHKWS